VLLPTLFTSRPDTLSKSSFQNLWIGFWGKREALEFKFSIGDPLELIYQLQFIGEMSRFNVVDFSTLTDEIGLVNTLIAGGQVLSDSPGSLLYTDTSSVTFAEVPEYIEESLCAPPSMFPTLYGLRLIKSSSVISTSSPKRMLWKRTPRYENLGSGDLTSSLWPYMYKLARKCFAVTSFTVLR